MRILYLDLDSLRPDHLGCYGYPRNTSPNIDLIAKEGVTFTNYYCFRCSVSAVSFRFNVREIWHS